MSNIPSDTSCHAAAQRTDRPGTRGGRRRGSVTIEAIVAIPLLTIVTFAAFQFAGTLAVEQAVSYAATVAARESGKAATDAEIKATVEAALAPFNIVTGANASVIVERFGIANSQIGTFLLTPPLTPALMSGETRVTVGLSLSVAPLSRLLANFGLDFSTRTFKASSLVRFES